MSSSSASAASTGSRSAAGTGASQPIVIAGAGLAGCMSALLLAQQYERRGIQQRIVVLEHRGDFRIEDRADAEGGRMTNAIKRSINLALSHRGMCALHAAGLSAESGAIIPMKNRLMHSLTGAITAQPYGTGDQAIYSISRRGLNELLLNELDRLGREKVEIIYNAKVTSVKQDGVVTYTTGARDSTTEHTLHAAFVVGADGAYSRVREEMRRYTRMDCSMQYIKHGYKELTIPARIDPTTGKPGYAMEPWQGLHIWPRDQFMLIALPNPDFSFTCTLFFPFEGPESLEGIITDEQILAYFQRYFPDVIPLMPDLISDFKASPNSALLQVRCDPYHAPGSRVCILGDAAHAVVPFYGQGMNAAFEDCLLLSEIMQSMEMDHFRALPEFSRRRVAAGQALADLSYRNYIEMRHDTASSLFLARKKLEAIIHRVYPKWIPQYTMVAFTRIPYDEAVRRAAKQDRILKRAVVVIGAGLAGAALLLTTLAVKRFYPNALPERVNLELAWPKGANLPKASLRSS